MPNPKDSRGRVALLVGLMVVLGAVVVVQLLRDRSAVSRGLSDKRITYEAHSLSPLEPLEPRGDTGSAEFRRNPFIYGVPPTATPRPVTPLPTRPPVQRTPQPTPTPRMARGADGRPKPPPPPFDREFLGHFGPLRMQVAAFRRPGLSPELSEIEVAKVGDVLDGIFIVREIGLESVKIGFVGYDPSEDTRVPLSEN
ncbi:MAG TPA: hypothetical protein PKJ99_00260 [Thermoanaerobaculales bacterium]|nr:hypothetical protein [Thermoanaerobaculales bacterium]HQL31178.1 hypothetical protein [Thermoanaerobaculales bacterium]